MLKYFLIIFVALSQVLSAEKSDIRTAGDIGQLAIPLTAFGISMLKNDREGLHQLADSSLVTMGTVYTLKYTIDSKRPKGGHFSFPSGHTASAFMGAAYLDRRYGVCYGLPAYIAASFVGYSRVYAKKHYPIDVIAGVAIAIIANYRITKPYFQNCDIMPVLNRDCVGIAISFWK